MVLDPTVTRCKCGNCVECVKLRIEKAFVFRDAVIAAVAWAKTDRLETLVGAHQLHTVSGVIGAIGAWGISRRRQHLE